MSQPNNPQDKERSQQFQQGGNGGQDQGNRSEGLLPADQSDPTLQVAEEVAFDLQSDDARRVGAMPEDAGAAKPAEAVAQALQPGKDQGDASAPPASKDR